MHIGKHLPRINQQNRQRAEEKTGEAMVETTGEAMGEGAAGVVIEQTRKVLKDKIQEGYR